MIDRKARDSLAEQIRYFLAGLSDNFRFDDVVFDIKTKDLAVVEIRYQMWHTYDDLSRHKLKGKWELSDEDKIIVKRMILFLKTDFECYKPNKNTDWSLWPFSNKEHYAATISEPRYLNNAT